MQLLRHNAEIIVKELNTIINDKINMMNGLLPPVLIRSVSVRSMKEQSGSLTTGWRNWSSILMIDMREVLKG